MRGGRPFGRAGSYIERGQSNARTAIHSPVRWREPCLDATAGKGRPAVRRIMAELPECVDGLPNLCGSEQLIDEAVAAGRDQPVFLGQTPVEVSGIDSAFAVALHMHQPLIPAGG